MTKSDDEAVDVEEEEKQKSQHEAGYDEAEVDFWVNWDPRRAPKGDVRRGRKSKGDNLNMTSIFMVTI
jgi:hypothetical protein